VEVDIFGNLIVEEKEVEKKVTKPSPFTFSNDIANKKYPSSFDGYNAYLLNLSLSQRKDTVLYANEMNKYHQLPIRSQFDFYFYGLPKKPLFAKWAKASKEDNIDAVREYYNCSVKEAQSYLRVLTIPQLSEIEEWFAKYKGGPHGRRNTPLSGS